MASVWMRQNGSPGQSHSLALAEHHFPAGDDDGQQRQTDRFKAERVLPQLCTLGDEIVWLAKQKITSGECQQTDRRNHGKRPSIPAVGSCAFPAELGLLAGWCPTTISTNSSGSARRNYRVRRWRA